MKKRDIKARSEASRKAWRTRKRMTASRQEIPKWAEPLVQEQIKEYFDILQAPDYRRALPNPWLNMFK